MPLGYMDRGNNLVPAAPIPDEGDVGYLDIIGATFRQENTVGSYLNQEPNIPSLKTAVSQDVISDMAAPKDYRSLAISENQDKQYLKHFDNVRTDTEYASLKRQISKETQDRELISKAGTSTQLLAGLTAGVVDLDASMLLPAFKVASSASKAVNVAKNVAQMATVGAVASTSSEALLKDTQVTRDDDYYSALVGGALLGGGLGGAVSIFRKSPFDIESLEKDLGRAVLEESNDTNYGISSVGAAEAKATTTAEEGLAGNVISDKMAGVLAQDRAFLDNPVLQTLTSPFKTSRVISQQLAETTGLRIKKAEEGKAVGFGVPAIETANKLSRGVFAKTQARANELWSQMLTGEKKGVLGRAKLSVKSMYDESTMSFRDFQREVGIAMKNNDTHEIPEIQEMAKVYRQEVFNPLRDRAVALDLLPEGVTPETAASYFTRIYDIDAIVRNSDKFDDVTTKWLTEQQEQKALLQDKIEPIYNKYKSIDDLTSDEAKLLREQLEELAGEWQGKSSKHFKSLLAKGAEGKKLDDAFNAAIKKILSTETRLIDSELRYLAGEIRDRITASHDGRLPYEKDIKVDGSGKISSTGFLEDAQKPGMFKNRAFAIPDNLINDFTINDADMVASSYHSSATPYMNMYERFDGDTELVNVRSELRAEKEAMLRKLEGDESPKAQKEREKIDKQYKNDIASIVALRQRALGRDFIAGDPTRLGARIPQTLRTFNVVTLLGGMTFSAIPDLGRLVALQSSAFNSAVKPIIANLVAGDGKIVAKKFAENNYFGTVVELVSNNRVMHLGDVTDDIQPRTKFERAINYLGDKTGITTLMAPWNESLKQIAAITTEHAILDIAEKLSKGGASKKEITFLAGNRIDDGMAKRILDQYKQFGENHKGLKLLNAQDWTDLEARQSFLSALTEEVDRIILTPGYDKSVMMTSSVLHQLFWQFKSFFAKATTNILLRGVQDFGDLRSAAQLTTMIGLGMMVYAGKTMQANRELSDNPAVWIIEGFDRAGVGGIMMEVNNISEKAFGVGLRPMVGGEVSSRHQSRSTMDSVMGPTYGMILNLMRIARVMGTQEINEGDINAMLRMVPYQNHPLLAYPKNRLKETLVEATR